MIKLFSGYGSLQVSFVLVDLLEKPGEEVENIKSLKNSCCKINFLKDHGWLK